MSKILATAAVLLAASTTLAAAATRTPDIDRRQDAQQRTIVEGRRDGGITWLESYRLKREQARIAALERSFKADGTVTPREREVLRAAQTDAGRHIDAERHDQQVRGFWWRLWR